MCISSWEKKVWKNFINKVFDAIWKDGLNLNDDAIVEKLLKNLDINPKNFLNEADNQEVKNDLKKRTDDAYNKGIFGTPTFIINNKMFWGQDRLDFVINEAKKWLTNDNVEWKKLIQIDLKIISA